ncbi:uncharacterized protein FIBRA_06541 [Fibroporia radiculosa]|uniref:Amidohydrolase 3 domain-containing protein n=1 Tax=Fibroporia radiculosa TaxID=599839 RepID=J4GBT4_9APHY|nr:uncharacterized protein FIBRA_06541 [Fibroporia radiculosa]CCM04368.1 predicted protein [Fibroporia radiculosa]
MPSSKPPPSSSRPRPQGGDRKSAADSPSSASTGSKSAPPRLGVCCRTPLTVLVISLTLSLGYFLLPSRLATTPPDSYALCSPDGNNIFTAHDAHPRVQCLVVHGSRFADAGSLHEVQHRWPRSVGENTTSPLRVHFIQPGQIVVPGLSDSHAHILEYGAMKQIPLEGAHTAEETVARVKDYILSNPELRNDKSKYVEGWGWDHTQWKKEEWPNYDVFESDPDVAGRPIVLQSKDGHALWISSTVLKLMEPIPEEVPGGAILRDSSGKPTGVFLDNAQDLVVRPDPTYEMLEKRFATTVKEALARGLTAIHDAGLSPLSLDFFRRQADEGKLPIRIYGMTYYDENADYWGDRVSKIVGAGNNRLTARSIKVFADGALRTGGAALYEPYADNPETRGFMRIEPEVLNSIIPRFMRDGWQVNVHAIGDRANGVVLDAFEEALKGVNVSALRPRLEHAQILAEADMARFGNLGVIASIQPTHAISDMWFGEERLGPERVKGLYAFRSILNYGARITLGSDFPVEDMNPLAGFYAAITRLSPDGTSPHGPGGWFPEQRMSREEALKGMTIDPAYASFSEDTLGSIVAGKHADYVVLSQDIMSVPADTILDTTVVATVLDGRAVYGSI